MTKLSFQRCYSSGRGGDGAPVGGPTGLDVFYPIVPDAEWVSRIVPLGVRTVQLRIKDANREVVAQNIKQSLEICRAHRCQLIVNDHWREAIKLGADFVHLGQEDLLNADVRAIKECGLRLGVSTHSEPELETALAVVPDYVALGPVYETKLKAMAFAPQGLGRISKWNELTGSTPLVGIGGISLERARGVIDAGASVVSVITDFITHSEPEARVEMWLKWAKLHRRAA